MPGKKLFSFNEEETFEPTRKKNSVARINTEEEDNAIEEALTIEGRVRKLERQLKVMLQYFTYQDNANNHLSTIVERIREGKLK